MLLQEITDHIEFKSLNFKRKKMNQLFVLQK